MSIKKEQKEHLKRLGLQLKKIRLLKGLTLKELGYLIDKDPQSISRVEMGDINPSYLYLMEVCKGLGVEIWEVLKSD
jgi:transcriptional regulator with XRE-family HTH domain